MLVAAAVNSFNEMRTSGRSDTGKVTTLFSVGTYPRYLPPSQHELGLGDGGLHRRRLLLLLRRLAWLLRVPRVFTRFGLQWGWIGKKEIGD